MRRKARRLARERKADSAAVAAGGSGSWSTMARLTLPLLLAVCFVIKLVVLFQLHTHPLLQPHGEMDTAYYVELGRRVAEQGGLGVTEPFFVSPLYVYFIALVFA